MCNCILLLLLTLCLLILVAPNKPFPAIPDVFYVDIQMNVAANKTTKHLFEMFDARKYVCIVPSTHVLMLYFTVRLLTSNANA